MENGNALKERLNEPSSGSSDVSSAKGFTLGFSCPRIVLAAICVFLPMFILLCVFWKLRLYPFGDTNVLMEDLYYQFVNLMTWLHNVFNGNGNLLYSFSKSLGGNMLPTFSYYLGSPLNLLLVFFDSAHIVDFVVLTQFIRVGLSGLTFAFFCKTRFKGISDIWTIAMSASYALSQYVLTQACNILWMDAIVLLPLIAVGIYRFVRSKKSVLLFVSLLVAIISSWYVGYMLVLATLLIYIYESVLYANETEQRPPKAFFLKSLLRFVFLMLLVLGAACCVLLPTANGLIAGKATGGGDTQISVLSLFKHSTDPWNVFSSFFFAQYQQNWSGPQFFCGTLSLVAVIYFFLSPSIRTKEKVIAGVFLFILTLSAVIVGIDMVWTGFSSGQNYYCRWGFIFDFFCMAIGLKALATWSKDGNYRIFLAILIVFSLSIIVYLQGGFNPFKHQGVVWNFYVLFLLILAGIFLFFFLSKRYANSSMPIRSAQFLPGLCLGILALVLLADLGVNAYTILKADHLLFKAVEPVSAMNSYIASESSAYANVESSDDSVFRADKSYSMVDNSEVPTNEGLALGYRPLSGYLSTNDTRVNEFTMRLGYTTRNDIQSKGNEFHTAYSTSILPSDALLGIKYVESSLQPDGYSASSVSTGMDDRSWYKNDYALPLGFAVSDDALSDIDEGEDSFEYQNNLFSALCGRQVDIYDPLTANEVSCSGTQCDWDVSGYGQDDVLYGEFESSLLYRSEAKIKQPDEERTYFTRFSNGIFDIENSSNGLSQISLTGTNLDKDSDLSLKAYRVNRNNLDDVMSSLGANAVQFDTFEDGYVKAHFSSDEETTLLFTIPYDRGWNVTVNGVRVQPETVDDALMALQVPAGESVIEMKYVSPGLIPGLVICGISVAAFAAWQCIASKRRRRRIQKV